MNDAVAPSSTRDLAAGYARAARSTRATDWGGAIAAAAALGERSALLRAAAGVDTFSSIGASASPAIAALTVSRDVFAAHDGAHTLASSIAKATGLADQFSSIASQNTSSWATTIGRAAALSDPSRLAGITGAAGLITKLRLHDDQMATLGSLRGIGGALAVSEGMQAQIAKALGPRCDWATALGTPVAAHQSLLAATGRHAESIRRLGELYPAAQTVRLAGLASGYADLLSSTRPRALLDTSLAARAVRAEWAQSPIARAATKAITQHAGSLIDVALDDSALLPHDVAAGWATIPATSAAPASQLITPADPQAPLQWSGLHLTEDQCALLRRHGVTWVGAFTFFEIVLNHLVDTDQHAIDILWWASVLATAFTLACIRRQK